MPHWRQGPHAEVPLCLRPTVLSHRPVQGKETLGLRETFQTPTSFIIGMVWWGQLVTGPL